MNYEATGRLIVKDDVQQISDKFKKREFVIEVENERNSDWNDLVKFQLTQDRCDLVVDVNLNDTITVGFNLRGRKWENDGKTSYFTNLEAWRVKKTEGSGTAPTPEYAKAEIPDSESEVDNLPF